MMKPGLYPPVLVSAVEGRGGMGQLAVISYVATAKGPIEVES